MVILLLLIFQLLISLKKAKFNKALVYITIVSLVWNLGFLIVLHLELIISNPLTATYGSDETAFFQKMMYANNLDDWFSYVQKDYNFSYLLLGTLILKTSLIESVFLVRLVNIFLGINTIVMLYFFAKRFLNVRTRNFHWVILFFALNGMITWTSLRILKDTLFIYALVAFLYLFFDLIFRKKLTFPRIIFMITTLYVLNDIRQWFIYLVLVLLVVIVMAALLKRRRYFLFAFISIISIPLILIYSSEAIDRFLIYTVAYNENFGASQLSQMLSGSFLSLPISMGRFIVGPGPIRGVFGGDAFLTYTITGNILITLGSLMWWFFIPVFIMALFSFKNIKNNYGILVVLLFYWATYSYAYAGSGDTRLRAVFYILAAIYTIPYLENLRKRNFISKYIAILIPVFLIGAYVSYKSLA